MGENVTGDWGMNVMESIGGLCDWEECDRRLED